MPLMLRLVLLGAFDGHNRAEQATMSTDHEFLTDQWFLEVYLPSLAAQPGQQPGALAPSLACTDQPSNQLALPIRVGT